MTHNNITGDKIATKAPTKAYRDGWEQAFGKKPEVSEYDRAVRVLQRIEEAGDSVSSEADRFWRNNVRPGTTFGMYSRQPTPWQKFYDWLFKPKPTPPVVQPGKPGHTPDSNR